LKIAAFLNGPEEVVVMSDYPHVSVIIPTYNYARYLPRAIESVLIQTYQDFELIVVDDGSTDETVSVMDAYTKKHPERLQYIRQNNSGPNAARNRGIGSARGEYIALLDADDEWLPQKLEKQIACARDIPDFGIIGCGLRWVTDDGTVLYESSGAPTPPRDELIRHLKIKYFDFGSASGVLIRKACFDVVGMFDESLRGSEDRDMWLRIAYHFYIVNLPDVLVIMHYHQANCHKNIGAMLKSKFQFIDKNLVSDGFIFRQRAVGYAYLDAAREALESSQYMNAFIYSLRAICNFPLKTTPDDDKFRILLKAVIPAGVLEYLRPK
jgi:glycosyltransferase involved in cell wall biosynthesis